MATGATLGTVMRQGGAMPTLGEVFLLHRLFQNALDSLVVIFHLF